MPIRPENQARYPKDWTQISLRIRFERAEGQCECFGECGVDHLMENGPLVDERCAARHNEDHHVTGSNVVLTVAHLDHTPENCDDENLKAMCQRCHLRYDADHHRLNSEATRRKKLNNHELFEV